MSKYSGQRNLHLCTRYTDFAGIDYTLNNPDTLTKYKSAAQISQKVLEAVSALCLAGSKIVDICEQGDKLLEEEIAKVYRGKKITKGMPLTPELSL